MAYKNISISEEVYSLLSSLKKEKESFTHLLSRLAQKKQEVSLLEFGGKWEGNQREIDKISREIRKLRGDYYGML